MSSELDLDLALPPPPVRRDTDRVFTRIIATPPGAPWEQARAAELDARLRAPMPVSTLAIRLVRLEPWRPRAAGRFAAFYARSEASRIGLTVEQEVEGRSLKVAFRSRAQQARQLRDLVLLTAGAVTAIGLIVGAQASALADRAKLEQRLARDIRQAAAAARQGKLRNLAAQARVEIKAAGLDGRGLSEVMVAMAAVGGARNPEADTTAFHWDHGFAALETASPAQPLVGKTLKGEKGAGGAWFWPLGEAGR